MATKTILKKTAAPAARVIPSTKAPVVPVKQSGGTIPTGSGFLSGGGFFTPRPPTVGENFGGGIAYILSDPFNQGTYREVQSGETTTGANVGQEIQTAVEGAVGNIGVDLQNFLIQKGGWIVALVVVVALMIAAGQSFLRG